MRIIQAAKPLSGFRSCPVFAVKKVKFLHENILQKMVIDPDQGELCQCGSGFTTLVFSAPKIVSKFSKNMGWIRV
jgi:hypothetical protein